MTTPARRLLLVCGIRPEAIKMAPLMRRLATVPGIEARLCETGQHREMLDQVLALFELVPHIDLDVMRAGQDLTDVSTAVTRGLRDAFADRLPDLVLVHGDTSSAEPRRASLATVPAGDSVLRGKRPVLVERQ